MLPKGWEYTDARESPGNCRILLRPRSWPEEAGESGIELDEYPVLLTTSTSRRAQVAASLGFEQRNQTWEVRGEDAMSSAASRTRGDNWTGFGGEINVREYRKGGGYWGLGQRNRILILADDGRTGALDSCCVRDEDQKILQSLRFTKPRAEPKLSHELVPGALPFVKVGAWGRCGYWETTFMVNGVAIQRTENQCEGYSPRQTQVQLNPEQIRHLKRLVEIANFSTMPPYVASLLAGAIPQNPRRITVFQGDQEYAVAAATVG